MPSLSDDRQAEYLVALYLKLGIREVLLSAYENRTVSGIDAPFSWFNRNDFYKEIDEISFSEYAHRFLMPELQQAAKTPEGAAMLQIKPGENVSYEKLVYLSSLRSLETTLRSSPDIRVIHTIDDFLINAQDIQFLDSALKDHIAWFNVGGHCGEFYLKPFQQMVLDAANKTW